MNFTTTISSTREAPQGPTMLAREAGTPSFEHLLLDPPQEFSGQNGVNCSLTRARQGLSTAAHPNNLLESQAKLALGITSDETRFRLFSGAQFRAQLGRNWGAIKRPEHDLGPKPALERGGDLR